MPRRWLRYTSKCMNGREADRLALNISDVPANAVLSENRASARTRILEVSALWPFTAIPSGVDTTTTYTCTKVGRLGGHCRNIPALTGPRPQFQFCFLLFLRETGCSLSL